MFWRLPPADYEDGFRQRSLDNVSGGPNKEAMKELVLRGTVPGLLAFRESAPIGWVAVSPRDELVRLAHVRTLASEGEPGHERAWSISCFYIHRADWRTGVGTALLEGAIARATEHGATVIECYPVKPGSIDPYTGYDTMFAAAGFELVRPGTGRGRALWRRSLSG